MQSFDNDWEQPEKKVEPDISGEYHFGFTNTAKFLVICKQCYDGEVFLETPSNTAFSK